MGKVPSLVAELGVPRGAYGPTVEADAVGAQSAVLCGGALVGCEADPGVKDCAEDVGAPSGARALVASEYVNLGAWMWRPESGPWAGVLQCLRTYIGSAMSECGPLGPVLYAAQFAGFSWGRFFLS